MIDAIYVEIFIPKIGFYAPNMVQHPLETHQFFSNLKKRTIHEITGQLKSSKLITQILILNAQHRDFFFFFENTMS